MQVSSTCILVRTSASAGGHQLRVVVTLGAAAASHTQASYTLVA
jgi:hypothetical protein